MTRYRKQERRDALKSALSHNPFLTDEELAQRFGVSVSTIRLDRGKLDIPEVRLRTLAVAHESISTLKALGQQEIIGSLLELRIGEYARSELIIDESMVLAKARVARGHHLFAQVNSLAIAVVDAEVAVTGSTRLKFVRPVRLGERVVAEGHVIKRKDNKYWVEVVAEVGEEQVLKGRLVVFAFAGSIRRE
ncbi:transcription factor FapR [Paradesulfitobacterium aromaticivorans]